MEEIGAAPCEAWLIEGDHTLEGGMEAMENLLKVKPRPTAIVTINDYVALDAIQYARKTKLKINKDIVFVSYANLPITNYLEFPPLASVEQFPYEQAKKATEILFELLEEQKNPDVVRNDYQNILLEGKLIIHKK